MSDSSRRATRGLVVVAAVGISWLAWAVRSAGAPGPELVDPGVPVEEILADAGLSMGPSQSPVRVWVLGDYECPACRALDASVGARLRNMGARGLIRFTYVHAPLAARRRGPAAAAAHYCGALLGAPWAMHERLERSWAEWNHGPASRRRFRQYARDLGLDVEEFNRCLDDPSTRARVERDRNAADELGLAGVPTVVVNGLFLRPVRSVDEVTAYVEALVSGAG